MRLCGELVPEGELGLYSIQEEILTISSEGRVEFASNSVVKRTTTVCKVISGDAVSHNESGSFNPALIEHRSLEERESSCSYSGSSSSRWSSATFYSDGIGRIRRRATEEPFALTAASAAHSP